MSMFRTHVLFTLALAVGIAVAGAAFATAPAGASSTAAPVPGKSPMMSRDEVTRILASNRRIVSPDGIDEKIKVHINGIDQWLSIRGKDRRNPILLFLHGGHTDSVRPPSTRMIWPVTNGASRSSHSTAPATSSGAPARCNGVRASIAC